MCPPQIHDWQSFGGSSAFDDGCGAIICSDRSPLVDHGSPIMKLYQSLEIGVAEQLQKLQDKVQRACLFNGA